MSTAKTKAIPGVVRAFKPQALDLGVLQANLEAATKSLKAANSAALRANEAAAFAEAEYDSAKKALTAGVAQITASTKV